MRQVAVIGLGRFGYHVAETLTKLGHEVLAIDRDEAQIARVGDFVTYAVQCDGTDEKALRAISTFSSGYRIFASDLETMAIPMVIGPRRPINIPRIIMSFPNVPNVAE